MRLGALASPIKAGSSSADSVIIDTYIEEFQPDAELLAALVETGHDVFGVKMRAIKAIAADRSRPKYRRLGMRRIA